MSSTTTPLIIDPTVIDMGATHIRIGLSSSSYPLGIYNTETTVDKISSQLINTLKCIYKNNSLSYNNSIVIGVPGLVNNNGYITNALYTPFFGINVKKIISKSIQVPSENIYVLNDANLHGLGASVLLNNPESHLHISLGTAVGGAITRKGKLWLGDNGFAGEVGHIPSNLKLGVCSCGNSDCIDLALSGWSISRDIGNDWWNYSGTMKCNRINLSANAMATMLQITNTLLDFSYITISGHLADNTEFKESTLNLLSTKLSEKIIWLGNYNWKLACNGAQRVIMSLV